MKILRLGLYWPNVYKDATGVTKKCPECQGFAPFQNLLSTTMTSISSPWPFQQWSIDIMGPFPTAQGELMFLLVALDCFTKWIEAEPLATITGKHMIRFMWKNILNQFGTPIVLISDNGNQFEARPFKEWCEEKRIHHCFTSVAHPQTNGQTKI